MGYSPWSHKESDMAEATEHTHKTERDSQTHRTNLWLLGGRMGEGIVKEFGINTLLYLEWITDKDLLCSTGNPVTWQPG